MKPLLEHQDLNEFLSDVRTTDPQVVIINGQKKIYTRNENDLKHYIENIELEYEGPIVLEIFKLH